MIAPDAQWDACGSNVDDVMFETPDGRTHTVFQTDAGDEFGADTRDAFYCAAGEDEPRYIGSFPSVAAAKDAIRERLAAEATA